MCLVVPLIFLSTQSPMFNGLLTRFLSSENLVLCLNTSAFNRVATRLSSKKSMSRHLCRLLLVSSNADTLYDGSASSTGSGTSYPKTKA